MLLATDAQQVWAPTVGVVLVALIGGIVTLWTKQSGREEDLRTKSIESISTVAVATIEDYKAALAGKEELVETLREALKTIQEAQDARIEALETAKRETEERCLKLEEELKRLSRQSPTDSTQAEN
jgi:hypothetical protein